jgi:hypothetical protein
MAQDYAEARMSLLVKALDEATDTTGSPPLGGGTLSRKDFQSLLVGDPEFQQRLTARMVFASDKEKAELKRAIERALNEVLPPDVMTPAQPTGPTGPAGPAGAPAGPAMSMPPPPPGYIPADAPSGAVAPSAPPGEVPLT